MIRRNQTQIVTSKTLPLKKRDNNQSHQKYSYRLDHSVDYQEEKSYHSRESVSKISRDYHRLALGQNNQNAMLKTESSRTNKIHCGKIINKNIPQQLRLRREHLYKKSASLTYNYELFDLNHTRQTNYIKQDSGEFLELNDAPQDYSFQQADFQSYEEPLRDLNHSSILDYSQIKPSPFASIPKYPGAIKIFDTDILNSSASVFNQADKAHDLEVQYNEIYNQNQRAKQQFKESVPSYDNTREQIYLSNDNMIANLKSSTMNLPRPQRSQNYSKYLYESSKKRQDYSYSQPNTFRNNYQSATKYRKSKIRTKLGSPNKSYNYDDFRRPQSLGASKFTRNAMAQKNSQKTEQGEFETKLKLIDDFQIKIQQKMKDILNYFSEMNNKN